MPLKSRLVLALVAAMLAATGAQAEVMEDPPAATVNVVEGHTTWVEIDTYSGGGTEPVEPTRVLGAVGNSGDVAGRHVRWFDDGFIHRAPPFASMPAYGAVAVQVTDKDFLTDDGFRQCHGAVIATHRGVPLHPIGDPIESYVITDPFGNVYTVTKHNVDPLDLDPRTRKWSVPVLPFMHPAGDGCYNEYTVEHHPGSSPIDHGVYEVPYNALLWIPMEQVDPALSATGDREFGAGGASDDARTEMGNSHAHNPLATTDHGPAHIHATRSLDLYYLEEEPEPSGSVVFASNPDFANYHHH